MFKYLLTAGVAALLDDPMVVRLVVLGGRLSGRSRLELLSRTSRPVSLAGVFLPSNESCRSMLKKKKMSQSLHLLILSDVYYLLARDDDFLKIPVIFSLTVFFSFLVSEGSRSKLKSEPEAETPGIKAF